MPVVMEIIKYVLIMAAVTAIMKYLANQSKKSAAKDAKGNTILILPALYGVMGVGGCILGFGIMIWGIIDFDREAFGAICFLFIMFGGLGAVMLSYRHIYRIKLTPEGIVKRSVMGQYKSMAWEDIKSVTYSHLMTEVKMSDGTNFIKCYVHVIGFESLVYELSNRLNMSRAEMGIPEL